MDKAALIAALEQELARYLRRGLTDRAEQVQQEIVRHGGPPGATPRGTVPTVPDTPAPKRAAAKKPAKRKA